MNSQSMLIESPVVTSLPRMTEEEFVAWCDEDTKAEWIDGEIIMPPPANLQHVDLVGFLNFILRGFVTARNLGVVYGPELQVRFASLRRRRVPDLLFVSTERMSILKTTEVGGALGCPYWIFSETRLVVARAVAESLRDTSGVRDTMENGLRVENKKGQEFYPWPFLLLSVNSA